mgnify:FL=1
MQGNLDEKGCGLGTDRMRGWVYASGINGMQSDE